MNDLEKQSTGPIAWFARNHVAANLLMLMILAGGILSIFKIKVEIFPDMTLDMILGKLLGCPPDKVNWTRPGS